MKIRYLSIGAENTKLANGSTESIVIVENYGTLYATEKLLIDSQGTTRLEIRDGSKVYTPQVGLRLNPEILIKGNYAGLFIWDPATNEQTAVKTTNSSSAQCLLDYSGGGSSVYYGKSKSVNWLDSSNATKTKPSLLRGLCFAENKTGFNCC